MKKIEFIIENKEGKVLEEVSSPSEGTAMRKAEEQNGYYRTKVNETKGEYSK